MNKKFKHVILKIILFVLIFCSTIFVSSCVGDGGDGGDKIDAWVCAQDVVENKLKSPSTAKFCSYNSDNVKDLGNGKYEVVGYVDAQNGFGATVRKYFIVTLTLTENGYKNATCRFD